MKSSKEYYQDALNRADGSLQDALDIMINDRAEFYKKLAFGIWSSSNGQLKREAGKMETAILRIKTQLAKAKTKS